MQLSEWSPDGALRYSLRILAATLLSFAAAAQTAGVIVGLSLRKERSASGDKRAGSLTSR